MAYKSENITSKESLCFKLNYGTIASRRTVETREIDGCV